VASASCVASHTTLLTRVVVEIRCFAATGNAGTCDVFGHIILRNYSYTGGCLVGGEEVLKKTSATCLGTSTSLWLLSIVLRLLTWVVGG
jgi:hypothetical protein